MKTNRFYDRNSNDDFFEVLLYKDGEFHKHKCLRCGDNFYELSEILGCLDEGYLTANKNRFTFSEELKLVVEKDYEDFLFVKQGTYFLSPKEIEENCRILTDIDEIDSDSWEIGEGTLNHPANSPEHMQNVREAARIYAESDTYVNE